MSPQDTHISGGAKFPLETEKEASSSILLEEVCSRDSSKQRDSVGLGLEEWGEGTVSVWEGSWR